MARPIKEGLDYFPMDVDILHNIKIRRVIKQYGEKGFMAYVFLLCEIYKNSYYIEIKDNEVFELSDLFGITEDESLQMLDGLVNLKLFDAEMWKTKRILTSVEIQKRYFTAKIKKNINIKTMPYLLDMAVIPVKTQVIAEKNPVNSEEMPQSKVKESRVKERKVYNFFNSSSNSESAKNFAENDSDVETVEAEVLTPDSEQSSSENVFQIVVNGSGEFEAKCHKWYEELRKDEEWLSSIVRSSGKGMEVLNLLKDVLPLFESHIISMGESGQITTINDYKRRFINWWRCLDFKSAYEIQNRKEKKRSYNFERRQAEPLSNVDKAMECGKKAKIMAHEILRKSGGLENVF